MASFFILQRTRASTTQTTNIRPPGRSVAKEEDLSSRVQGPRRCPKALPCIAAKAVWEDRMRHRPIIHLVDNDAARFALIKGSSPTPDSPWLTGLLWAEEAKAGPV